MKPSLAKRLFRLAVLAALLSLGLVLLLWLGWIVLPWFALPAVIEPRVRELGRVGSWGREITAVVTIAAVVMAVFAFRRVFTMNSRQHWTAVGVLAGLAIAYFGLQGWLTRDHLVKPGAEPIFYWCLKPNGSLHKQSERGTNPYTGKPLKPASHQYLVLIGRRLREPLQPVDPARHDWFDANMGWPLLWYFRTPQGELEFYNRPAFHPRYQEELSEVTVALLREWEQEQTRQRAEAATRAAQALENTRNSEQDQKQEQIKTLTQQIQKLTEQRNLLGKLYDEVVAREAAAKLRPRVLSTAGAEAARRQATLDRRAHEVASPIGALDWLTPLNLSRVTSPESNFESFDARAFDDEFAWRRMRYSGRLSWVCSTHQTWWFEPVTIGAIHFVVEAMPTPSMANRFRAGQDITFSGVVVTFRFEPRLTNLNGTLGRTCIIVISDATTSSNSPTPVACAPDRRVMPVAGQSKSASTTRAQRSTAASRSAYDGRIANLSN